MKLEHSISYEVNEIVRKYNSQIREVQRLQEQIIQKLNDEIDKTPELEGVTQISPSISTVKLSTVNNTRSMIMDPRYYLKPTQTDEIKSYLFAKSATGVPTINDITKRIKTCIDQKYIKRSNNDKVMLNAKSLEVLTNIYNELINV